MDPMMAMMLAQGLQGFADNLGAARRGVAPPQQGGVQDMVPMMSMMQRNQIAQQEMAFRQQKMDEARRQAEIQQRGYEALAQEAGTSPELAAALGGDLTKALANKWNIDILSQVQDRSADNTRADKELSINQVRLALERGRYAREQEDAKRKVADDMLRNQGLVQFGKDNFGWTPEQSIAMGDQLTQLMKSRNEPSTLGVTQTRFQPGKDGVQAVASGSTPQAIDTAVKIANAGNPGVALGAKTYADERARGAAEQWKNIQQRATSSLERVQKFEALNNMIGDLPTGRIGEGARLTIAKTLRDLGADVDAKAISTREEALNLADTMGVQMLNDQSEGLKGISSDRDVALFLGLQPGINMTKQGRELNLDVRRAETEYVNGLADYLNGIEKKKGDFLTPVEQQQYISEYAKTHSIYEGVYNKWKGADGNTGGATPPPAPGSGASTGALRPEVEARLSAYPAKQ